MSDEMSPELEAAALAGLAENPVARVYTQGYEAGLKANAAGPVDTPEKLLAQMMERLRKEQEGADFTMPEEGEWPTPAQFYGWLLMANSAERLGEIEKLMKSAQEGTACWTANHVSEIDYFRGRMKALAARVLLLETRLRELGGDLS